MVNKTAAETFRRAPTRQSLVPKTVILLGDAVDMVRANSLAAFDVRYEMSIRVEVLNIEARHTCLLLPRNCSNLSYNS